MHRPRPARVWNAASLQGGTAPTPVREKRPKGACVQPTIPPLVPMPAQTAAKMRGSPPKALECSAETDSALEEAGFEPSRRERDGRERGPAADHRRLARRPVLNGGF